MAAAAGSGCGSGFFTSMGAAAVVVFTAGVVRTTAGVGASGAAETLGAASRATGFPQDSQNFTLGRSGAPHCPQTGRGSTLAPHDSQNFMPEAIGLLHFGQVPELFSCDGVMVMNHTRGVSRPWSRTGDRTAFLA